MKKALILICLIGLAGGAVLAADYYATKADYRAGIMTPGAPAPKAGTDDCTSPTGVGATLPYNDTGDTSAATSNVDSVPISCNGFYTTVPGPDHIYMFTVGTGNNLTLTTSTSDNDYDISTYAVSTCGDGNTCVGGSDSCFAVNTLGNPCGTDATEAFSLSGVAAGTYYFYVDSFYSPGNPDGRDSGPYTVDITGTLPVQLIEFEIK